jgi:hypothetical protein
MEIENTYLRLISSRFVFKREQGCLISKNLPPTALKTNLLTAEVNLRVDISAKRCEIDQGSPISTKEKVGSGKEIGGLEGARVRAEQRGV